MLIGALSPGISHAPIFSLSLVSFFPPSPHLSNRRYTRDTFLYFNNLCAQLAMELSFSKGDSRDKEGDIDF